MFEMANDGTLLLDEIGDMDVRLQAKLLQVLQDHEFQRIGGKEVIKVDVRIMAATHRDLEKAIGDGSFRADLFYRLNVINVDLPPLRERTEDVLAMAEFLLKKHVEPGAPQVSLTPELKRVFLAYHWPGNVRELENIIRQLIALEDPDYIVQTLGARIQQQPAQTATVMDAIAPLPPVGPHQVMPVAPIETGKAKGYPAAKFQAMPRPGFFADRHAVAGALGDKGTVIVNALGPQFHKGLEPSRYGRPGRVPGSVNVPAATLVDAKTKGFTTLADAATKFEAQGVGKDRNVVCYCGGGISATIDLFLLHQLGYDNLTLYDGSMGEWAKDKSLPIETD